MACGVMSGQELIGVMGVFAYVTYQRLVSDG